MMKQVFLLAALVLVVQAQEHGCAAPAHFQAQVQMHDHETNFYRSGYFTYDAIGERVRFLERVQENATRPQVDVLDLHHEKKRYAIDLRTRKCNVSELKYPFRPIAVRPESRFLSNSVIGLVGKVGEGVTVSTWEHSVNETDVYGHATVTFTRDECIPFTDSFYGMMKSSKKPLHFHRTYYDVTIGLNNPNIFDIPKECMKKW